MNELYLRYSAVSVYRSAAENIAPLAELMHVGAGGEPEKRIRAASEVFRRVANSGCDCTGEWMEKLVREDDNAFSRAAARGERISPQIKRQVESELYTFKRMSLLSPDDFCSNEERDYFPLFGFGGFNLTFDRLKKFYLSSGCGVLSESNAFTYDAARAEFVPTVLRSVRLSDLKSYDEEKAEIVSNTKNFLDGKPAFNALLYGDRGTGKSTTVHALAYENRDRLKIIELKNADIAALPAIYARLGSLKQKFIVFVDDLGFDENDGRIDGFKATLEGSLEAAGNVLLYCTSNRRHLIRESGAKSGEVKNRNDETQAELALFDRFGLVVTYVSPDKAEFLDIFKQILFSRGIRWREEYAAVAELSALKKGGRSPRAAKQIADLIESAYVENEKRS